MDTSRLKKFAQHARRSLIDQVSNKLKLVLTNDSAGRRENPQAVRKLEEQIKAHGEEQVIEQVAYTWFNRFCALRFMDVNRYTRVGLVSPAEGQTQIEILAEAKKGHVDENMVSEKARKQVLALISEVEPSNDPQGEAYRLLLVAACNSYHTLMPFMFERIADYTELLIPDDLLSDSSILAATREALTPEACQDVEVIGWLYQFYISEKKDDVFASLKKGKKITPENIPAATQLFTPHWIVRYLVENSLGRLWMLNHPSSRLVEQMDYYIKPEEPETDFLQISSPEDIKICDPACGSGHMLTYAFDLLYAIYEEQGYQATDIPRLILTHNLYGIEIDQRAGALAAFALTMKAREKYRRFLSSSKVVQPNICVLENIHIDSEDLSNYMDKVGRDLFTDGIQGVVNQFEEADNFGSLIRPLVTNVSDVLEILGERHMGEDLFLAGVHQKVLKALRQADYLSPKYHVVVANPPYMASRGMNASLKKYIEKAFPAGKADVFSAFIERALLLCKKSGLVSMVTMQSWMFLSSFAEFRRAVILPRNILNCVQIGFNSFPELNSKVALAVAFTCKNDLSTHGQAGSFFNLNDAPESADKELVFKERLATGSYFVATKDNFAKIPGSPIAYWASSQFLEAYNRGQLLEELIDARIALATGDNDQFIRSWSEVSLQRIGFDCEAEESSVTSRKKWFPCNKGGNFRKWYGNNEFVVNWENGGSEIQSFADEDTGRIRSHNYNGAFAFQECITWSAITTTFGARYSGKGFMFVTPGSSAFMKATSVSIHSTLAFLLSKVAAHYLSALSSSVNIEVGNLGRMPFIEPACDIAAIANRALEIVRCDWDDSESSWDFNGSPLLRESYSQLQLALSSYMKDQVTAVKGLTELEHQNNEVFIEAYSLATELTAEPAPDEISLNCNPVYRYGSDKSESELEALLLADTMREFISYAVGCMLGRYSLDKPGLILANQGETADDYRQQIPEPTFAPDEDNVIPLLDGDWFTDDISERFKKFLKVTFGTEHFEGNLTFLENALYPDNLTGKKPKGIRHYFLKDFYGHHVKMYKKRPIYWLFSSSKGVFNALIYMHRYRPDTVSVILNNYLREFSAKLLVQKNQLEGTSISTSASQSEKTKALKEINTLNKMISELEEYEREVLYPLATDQLEIDLDDGVKVNYPKFGIALKKVVGLS